MVPIKGTGSVMEPGPTKDRTPSNPRDPDVHPIKVRGPKDKDPVMGGVKERISITKGRVSITVVDMPAITIMTAITIIGADVHTLDTGIVVAGGTTETEDDAGYQALLDALDLRQIRSVERDSDAGGRLARSLRWEPLVVGQQVVVPKNLEQRANAVGTPDPLGNVILIPPESVQMRQAVEPGRR
jgi:hypothetical protein